MGQFRFEMTAVGGHGCNREVKDGGTVFGCGQQTCPDCALASLLAEFARLTNCQIESAKLIHWPGQVGEVVDEFIVKEGIAHDVIQHTGNIAVFSRVPRKRKGNF